MNKSLSLTYEKSGVVWLKFPSAVQSKTVKEFQKFVLTPENSRTQTILKLFENADLKSLFINKEGYLMGEEIGPNIKTLRFSFNLKKSLNNLRVIAKSTLTDKQIKKPEVRKRFILKILGEHANGFIKLTSEGKIQVNCVKMFTVLWYDFLRRQNPSKIFKKKFLKRIRLGKNLRYRTKKIIIRNKTKKIIKRYKTKKISITVSTVFFLVVGLIFLGVILSRPTQVLVEKYDLVTIDYKIWESNHTQNYNLFNTLIDETIVVKVIPITEQDDGLILGLYKNLIGKPQFFKSDFIWLDKCVDQNHNGVDDITGNPALSYGNSSNQYFGMYLMIQFKILDIK